MNMGLGGPALPSLSPLRVFTTAPPMGTDGIEFRPAILLLHALGSAPLPAPLPAPRHLMTSCQEAREPRPPIRHGYLVTVDNRGGRTSNLLLLLPAKDVTLRRATRHVHISIRIAVSAGHQLAVNVSFGEAEGAIPREYIELNATSARGSSATDSRCRIAGWSAINAINTLRPAMKRLILLLVCHWPRDGPESRRRLRVILHDGAISDIRHMKPPLIRPMST